MYKYSAVIRPQKVTNRRSDLRLISLQLVLYYINNKVQLASDAAYIKSRLKGNSKLKSSFMSMLASKAAKIKAEVEKNILGYRYDYLSYNAPEKAGDVVIAFSGARQGPGDGLDAQLLKRYGKNNYAIFRPIDVDKAVLFAKKLPKDSKIYVLGLSFGAPAAIKFALSGIPIERLITYDAVDYFTLPKKVPLNVKTWYNAIAGNYRFLKDSNIFTFLPKYIKSTAKDAAVDAMHRWDLVSGAINVRVPAADHVDVDTMYNKLNNYFGDMIMKSASYKDVLIKRADNADPQKAINNILDAVSNYAKAAPSKLEKFVSENKWVRPTAYGAGSALLTALLTGGWKPSIWRLLTVLAGGGAGVGLGLYHNSQAAKIRALKDSFLLSLEEREKAIRDKSAADAIIDPTRVIYDTKTKNPETLTEYAAGGDIVDDGGENRTQELLSAQDTYNKLIEGRLAAQNILYSNTIQ